MNLPELENSIIVHYGCSDFNSTEHTVYWIGAISHTPNKTYFFESRYEVEVIEKFESYVNNNNDKTFIHWSMNSPKFGFRAIENRYLDLTNNSIDFDIKNEVDLSEYLKNKYGINYIERQNGRLNNLAELNGFSGFKSDIEVINTNDATNRLELIFSIVQAEIQGNLKTLSDAHQQNEGKDPQIEEVDISIKLEEHFSFLQQRGRKSSAMMESGQFDLFIKLATYYFSNNFSLPEKYETITTNNVNKKKFLVELKEFCKLQENGKPLPSSLPDLANCVSQNNWSKVSMESLHRASTQ